MAHFAEIDSNNKVIRVLTLDDQYQNDGQNYLSNVLGLGGTWIQTSYNTLGGQNLNGGTPLNMNYAGVGFTWDSNKPGFYAPQPFPSWVLNQNTYLWEAPIVYPNDGQKYNWDESSKSWVGVS